MTRAAVGGPSFLTCCLDDDGRLLLSTERLVLDGEGWRHLHLTVRGAQHTLEVDGRALAPVRDVARGEGTLAFERPTTGRIWITHVRVRALGH